MIYPKIYFGPMSKNIVDSLLSFSRKYPIGFIPSRRQIEYDGGYVNNWTSKSFFDYVKSSNKQCLVCRDHGGRLQGKTKDNGEVSLLEDGSIGFDLIHVDPWKHFESLEEVAKETSSMVKKCLRVNPNLKFEIGTEEAIHRYTEEELRIFLELVREELGEKFLSIVYVVVQFGTRIVGTKNIGNFDKERAKKMIEVVKEFSLLSKEHNGDYLTVEEIKDRFSIGLDAINIAPEFGTMESSILINILADNMEMDKLRRFFQICFKSRKWEKWLPGVNVEEIEGGKFYDFLICRTSGHYHFTNQEVKSWKGDGVIDRKIRYLLDQQFENLLRNIYEGI